MGEHDRPLDDRDVTAILMSIGTQLREARQARGWRLSEIAETVAVSSSVICRLELARREPSLYQLIQVCAAMRLRFSDVLRVAENEAFPLGRAPWL